MLPYAREQDAVCGKDDWPARSTVDSARDHPQRLCFFRPTRSADQGVHTGEDHDFHRLGKRLAWKLFPNARYRSRLKKLECELRVPPKLGAKLKLSPFSGMLGVVQATHGQELL